MSRLINLFRPVLFVAAPVAALGSLTVTRADEVPAAVTAPAISKNLNKDPALDATQSIRNMVKAIGPEAAMDMMFSSVDPVCQKTLLSKATDPTKAPASIEDMRDDQYFRPAIVVGNQAAQWAKATPDGRGAQPLYNWMDPKNYWGWLRMNKPSSGAAQNTIPATAQPPKRY
jgi:hypothetical protein